MINLPNPQSKQWKQSTNSDLFGNISSTKNISFDQGGYLKLANSSRAIMNNTIDADFDKPAAIVKGSGNYFVPTWDSAFDMDERILTAYPTQHTTSGVPGTDTESDAIWSNSQLIVTQDTDVDYFSGSTWTDTNIGLTASGQHPAVNFLSLQAVAIADVYTVKLYNTPFSATPTLITTLNLPSDFQITQMAYLNQNLYIGTQHINGGSGHLFVWNGSGSAAQQAYKVDSNVILSLCVHQGTIWLTTGSGELLRFTGGGFERMAAFPIFYTDRSMLVDISISMFKNTMKSNGDVLYILFTDEGNSLRLLNQPDGVWCYDKEVGLYHKYSVSNALLNIQTIATTAVNTTTNEITVASPAPVTGTEVFYIDGSGTAIAGLTDATKYFTIKVDDTHVKLATTLANAQAGTAIDLTGTGNNTQTLNFFPNIDFGAFLAERTTALSVIEIVSNPKWGTDVIWGGEVSRRTLSGDLAYMGTTTGYVENRGYFVTPKIFSNEITDTFNNIVLKYSPFTSETDKIIVKYRTEDDRRDEIDVSGTKWRATWTSSTTFTTTQTDMADAEVGDEVEFLNGAAGGMLAHITAISENAGTYTVTIDETYANYITGDLSTFVFRNWTKLATISSTGNAYFSEQLGVSGKFLQLKIELRGIGTRIEELKVDNKYQLPASK